MNPSRRQPAAWRIIVGFLAAPAFAAAAFACFLPAYNGIPNIYQRISMTFVIYCLFGAYPTAVVFGVPTYLLLRNRLPPTLINCAAAGAFVAALPWLIVTVLPSPASDIQEGRHMEIVAGQKTIWWWLDSSALDARIAAAGLLGGLVFWLAINVGRTDRSTISPSG